MKEIYEGMTSRELLDEYKMAVENLPGSGARGRAWLADVESELMQRLERAGEE